MDHHPTTPRRGDWILTRSGGRFYPIDPRAEEVRLADIAGSLSNQCRWTGHTMYHYSIAQHACYVADAVEKIMPGLALAALHHDSPEAYIGDMARPWKRMLAVIGTGSLVQISTAENAILGAIFDHLDIQEPSAAQWGIIAQVDNRVLRTEFDQLLPRDDSAAWEDLGEPVPGLSIERWSPEYAYRRFIEMHDRLVKAETEDRS